MELLIKLAALSLCVSAVTALLKKSDEALSLLLLLAAVLVGCAMLLPALSELFDFCERALSLTDLPLTLFVPVVKVTAIALVARFSCALCADAGAERAVKSARRGGDAVRARLRAAAHGGAARDGGGISMKKLLCLLFAAFLLCVSASALELPSELDDTVPRELIDSAEAGDDLLLRGGQYLFFRTFARHCRMRWQIPARRDGADAALALVRARREHGGERGRRPRDTRAISACWARWRSQ